MTKKKTHEEFVKDVYNLVGDEYTVIGTYTLSKNKVLLRHNKCGKEWEVKANNFMNGNRCKHCRELKRVKSYEKYSKELENKYKGNIVIEGIYKTHDVKIKHRCLKHNHTFLVSPTNALRQHKKFLCPKCVNEYNHDKQKKDINKLLKDLKDKHGTRILLEGGYVNTHTKTTFRCTECSNTFKSEPNQVIRLSGCPYCKSSKGELLIQDLLNKHNVEFEREKRFKECRYKRELPFDFYIPSINTLIEFDGLQHTKVVDFFGGEDYLREIQIRDGIKNKYAQDNNIRLIRIPYTQNEMSIEKDILKLVLEVKQRT